MPKRLDVCDVLGRYAAGFDFVGAAFGGDGGVREQGLGLSMLS